jgi:Protein of unknown function (DUF2889)
VAVAPPRPGPRRALATSPAPAPGSVRRTTSIDVTRPDGLLGPVVAVLAGRDRAVDALGRARVLGEVSPAVRVAESGVIESIEGDVPPGLGGLVGTDLRSGFGRRAAAALPEVAARRTLWASLLDDLAGAYLVSGYALARGGVLPDAATGPERDDPAGWHALPPLRRGTVRRRRLLEVARAAAGPPGLDVRAHFRDSWTGDGTEIALHEYEIQAVVDGAGRLARVEVDPRVLPWEACPGAVGSAARVVGVAVADLPARVRADLAGPSTCTHLNSTLRSLVDVPALAAADTVATDAPPWKADGPQVPLER